MVFLQNWGDFPPSCAQNKFRTVRNQSLVTPVGRPQFRPTTYKTRFFNIRVTCHVASPIDLSDTFTPPPRIAALRCTTFPPSPHHARCSPGVRLFAKVRRTCPKSHHALFRGDSCSSSRWTSLASPVRAPYVFGAMIREPATGAHNFCLIISAISKKDTILRPELAHAGFPCDGNIC